MLACEMCQWPKAKENASCLLHEARQQRDDLLRAMKKIKVAAIGAGRPEFDFILMHSTDAIARAEGE